MLLDAPAAEPSHLAEELEARIAAELGVPITIMLRSAGELARVVAAPPHETRRPVLCRSPALNRWATRESIRTPGS